MEFTQYVHRIELRREQKKLREARYPANLAIEHVSNLSTSYVCLMGTDVTSGLIGAI